MIYADDNIHEALEKIASAEHEKTALSKQLLIRAAKAAEHSRGQLSKAWGNTKLAPSGSAIEKLLGLARNRRGSQQRMFESALSTYPVSRPFKADHGSALTTRNMEKLIGLKKSTKRAPMMPGYASASTVKMRRA